MRRRLLHGQRAARIPTLTLTSTLTLTLTLTPTLTPNPNPNPSPNQVNGPHDPVMQRKRMLDMAAVYLGTASPTDPAASPLLAPPAAFAGLPPTLVHVGDTEVLLDDSITLQEKARSMGVQLDVREWSHVLHSWHTFYPIMPKADVALKDISNFLRGKLDLDN